MSKITSDAQTITVIEENADLDQLIVKSKKQLKRSRLVCFGVVLLAVVCFIARLIV